MRKFLPLFFAIAFFAVQAYAATQFSQTAGTNIEWATYESVITPDTGLVDTLAGATDSITLWSMKQFDGGWHYVVKNGIISGGGSDSVVFVYAVDVYDKYKTRIGRYLSDDTVTTYLGSTIELPIGQKAIGVYYTIKAMSSTDNGGVVILNNVSIDRFRYVDINK